MSDLCEWRAEIVDDTLKQALIAAAEYCNNNKTKAIAHIKAQKDIRINKIARQGYKDDDKQMKVTYPIKKDLEKLYSLMLNNTNCRQIQQEAYKIDKKYARNNYYAFHKCETNKKDD